MTSTPPRFALLLVAAGKGTRLPGECPKAYLPLAGRMMAEHSLQAFAQAGVERALLVHHTEHGEWINALRQGFPGLETTEGGKERQDSVRLGLEALAADAPDFVLVHDAARPYVSQDIIRRVMQACQQNPAFPGVPLVDSVKQQTAEGWRDVPRAGLVAVQTPQGFAFDELRELHSRFATQKVTDDIALAERAGLPVTCVAGEPENMKITFPQDLQRSLLPRTGMGFDVHAFIPQLGGSTVRICGVDVPCDAQLEGHSDGDVGLHALTDAIFGALCVGDLGQHFAPGDTRWKGADSAVFLAEARRMMEERDARLLHADITIISQKPKIAPYRDAMRQRIADIMGVPVDCISVKATTTDHLGFTGREEGIAAQAVATVGMPQ